LKYDFILNMKERRSQTLILKKIKRGSVVLELGSATGIMTRYMKEALDCKVYICEIDEQAIDIARQYAQDAWLGDIESLEWIKVFGQIKFDYIVCADVLEHLRDPAKILKEAGTLLKEEGSILISIPNVSHNDVVLPMLENRFEYTQVGILDSTHLRFFSYNTLLKMCFDTGYIVVEEEAIYENRKQKTGLEWPDSVKFRKFSHVFQFVFELKKIAYVLQNGILPVKKIEEYPKNNIFQIFADTGRGLNEQESIRVKTSRVGDREITFDLSCFKDILAVRIDPSESACSVMIHKLTLIDEYSQKFEVNVPLLYSNAAYHYEKLFIFNKSDPQIPIDKVCANLKSIYIQYEFLDFNVNLPMNRSVFLIMQNEIQTLKRKAKI